MIINGGSSAEEKDKKRECEKNRLHNMSVFISKEELQKRLERAVEHMKEIVKRLKS